MMGLVKEVLSDITNLASIVTSSKTLPLSDKIHAREIEKVAKEKIQSLFSISPFGSQKIVKDFLTVGDVDRIANIGVSNINLMLLSFSSLIFQKDKEITCINLEPKNKNKEVKNTFTGITGKVKMELMTSSMTYLLILGDDHHYHLATANYWTELE